MKNSRRPRIVYYDATCPMCTAFRGKVEDGVEADAVVFKDANTVSVPDGLGRSDLLREMHVVSPDGSVHSGAESIYEVLSQHRWLWPLAILGRLPLIRTLGRYVYRLVAAQRHFFFGAASRILWLRIIVTLGLLVGLLLSLPLWVGGRTVPLVPVWSSLAALPTWIPEGLFAGLIGGVLWAIVSPRPRVALWLCVGLLVSLVLLDQNRFQPWVYQYGVLLMLLATFSWQWRDVVSRERILNTARLLLSAMYIYSGIQKFNPTFFTHVFPWMSEPIFGSHYELAVIVSLFVPLIEMAIGVGLLFRRTRRLALFGAVAMLVFVLAMIGPLGHNWNFVVWPWNVAFAAMAFVLFCRSSVTLKQIFSSQTTTVSLLILVLFVVCPALFFVGKWDAYPSFSLYSGNTASFSIEFADKAVIPEKLLQFTEITDEQTYVLRSTNWAVADIRVPMYPEVRVLESVAYTICQQISEPDQVMSPGWDSNPRMAVLQTAVLTASPPGRDAYYITSIPFLHACDVEYINVMVY